MSYSTYTYHPPAAVAVWPLLAGHPAAQTQWLGDPGQHPAGSGSMGGCVGLVHGVHGVHGAHGAHGALVLAHAQGTQLTVC